MNLIGLRLHTLAYTVFLTLSNSLLIFIPLPYVIKPAKPVATSDKFKLQPIPVLKFQLKLVPKHRTHNIKTAN